MSRQEAVNEARKVGRVVARWKPHFKAVGMTAAEIDRLAAWIDRPALLDQRRGL